MTVDIHDLFQVKVPENVQPGDEFEVYIGARSVRVQYPLHSRPGECLLITFPKDSHTTSNGKDTHPPPKAEIPMAAVARLIPSSEEEKVPVFDVEVPKGVQPGAPFALLAGGVHVLITCSSPGQCIRFKLPLTLTQEPMITSESAQIKLKYDNDGWIRTIRATDLKFQWIRMDDNVDVDLNTRCNLDKSAFVRKLEFRKGANPRIRTGILSLVPACKAVANSKIKSTDGRNLVTFSDLAQAHVKSFDEKAQWFHDTCAELCVEWIEGNMPMYVRRQFLLGDSIDAVMRLSRKDMRKIWIFESIGQGDAVGSAREWFELVWKEIFDPDTGLWMTSSTNPMRMTIKPVSEFHCLVYYRFLGRVIGKAMLDGQLVNGHFTEHIYKHMLGWPIEFRDLESVDEDCYRYLQELQGMKERGEDLACLGLNFTLKDMTGVKEEVELVKGGNEIAVTNDNFPQYVEACLKYKLMYIVHPHMKELLLGFFDVIPEPLLTIFDYQEFERLMCGNNK